MQPAILTCEYLVSPAYCDVQAVDQAVDDLLAVKKALDQCTVLQIFLEDDALEKLEASGEYPTDRLFGHQFAVANFDVFSAKDVARMVHNIIGRATQLSAERTGFDVELKDQGYSPGLTGRSAERRGALEEVVRDLGLRNAYDSWDACLLHICRVDAMPEIVFKATVTEIYPAMARQPPFELESAVRIRSSWRRYLEQLPHLNLFRRFRTNEDLRVSIYGAAVARLVELKRGEEPLGIDDFNVSPEFADSLRRNQCSEDGAFVSVALEAIADVLARVPSTTTKIFATKAGGAVARRHNAYSAYRAHVTKGGLALRLMFWKSDEGRVVFANIGPKSELRIAAPE